MGVSARLQKSLKRQLVNGLSRGPYEVGSSPVTQTAELSLVGGLVGGLATVTLPILSNARLFFTMLGSLSMMVIGGAWVRALAINAIIEVSVCGMEYPKTTTRLAFERAAWARRHIDDIVALP